MSPLKAFVEWLRGPLPVDPADIHRDIRKAVHQSRNNATIAIAELRMAEKASNKVCLTAQKAISKLEAIREGKTCDG